jgi:hypothetical protein
MVTNYPHNYKRAGMSSQMSRSVPVCLSPIQASLS